MTPSRQTRIARGEGIALVNAALRGAITAVLATVVFIISVGLLGWVL